MAPLLYFGTVRCAALAARVAGPLSLSDWRLAGLWPMSSWPLTGPTPENKHQQVISIIEDSPHLQQAIGRK
jgi:hypothetical protein